MNTTAHLLSTEANKKRLLESIAQDKKTSEKGMRSKGKLDATQKSSPSKKLKR